MHVGSSSVEIGHRVVGNADAESFVLGVRGGAGSPVVGGGASPTAQGLLECVSRGRNEMP